MSLKSLLHIGADAQKTPIERITKALLRIITSAAGDDVKKAAISAVIAPYSVHNVSVMNSTFQAGK